MPRDLNHPRMRHPRSHGHPADREPRSDRGTDRVVTLPMRRSRPQGGPANPHKRIHLDENREVQAAVIAPAQVSPVVSNEERPMLGTVDGAGPATVTGNTRGRHERRIESDELARIGVHVPLLTGSHSGNLAYRGGFVK